MGHFCGFMTTSAFRPSVLCFIVSVTMRRKAEGSPRSQKCVICSQAKSSEQGACTPIKFHSLLEEHRSPRPWPRPDNLAFSPPCATWVISLPPKVPKDPTMYVRMRHAGNNLSGGRAEWRGGRRISLLSRSLRGARRSPSVSHSVSQSRSRRTPPSPSPPPSHGGWMRLPAAEEMTFCSIRQWASLDGLV